MKTDADLMKLIREQLSAHPALTDCLSSIYLIINDSDVLLSGQVDTAEQRALIRKTIFSVQGVGELMDELKVQKGSRHRHDVDINWSDGQMDVR